MRELSRGILYPTLFLFSYVTQHVSNHILKCLLSCSVRRKQMEEKVHLRSTKVKLDIIPPLFCDLQHCSPNFFFIIFVSSLRYTNFLKNMYICMILIPDKGTEMKQFPVQISANNHTQYIHIKQNVKYLNTTSSVYNRIIGFYQLIFIELSLIYYTK